MDATKRAICLEDPFNPFITTSMQAGSILVISHVFHLILKPLGQPGPIAQILAGIVLGPSFLSRIKVVREFFIQSSSEFHYKIFQAICSVTFMFLMGLEMDIPYMRRNLSKASIIACGGVAVAVLFGIATSIFVILVLRVTSHYVPLANLIIIVLANSATPVVFRLATELKFLVSDTGRLAVLASLITELSCILWSCLWNAFSSLKKFGLGLLCLGLTAGVVVLNKYLALWCNQRNRNQKYVTNKEVLVIMFFIVGLALVVRGSGYNGMISCFVIGLMFPREGKTTRTLLQKLSYAIYNFMLPVYFGYTGFQLDVSYINSYQNLSVLVVMIIVCIASKVIGTLAACHYLQIPTNEGILLAFLLDLKGNAELLILNEQVDRYLESWKNQNVHNLVVITVVINTVIAGPAVAYILRKKEEYFTHRHTSLELGEPESELRLLSCVYGSRHVTSKIGLISAFSESLKTPVTAYLMHLVELPKKKRSKKNLMYHQLKDGDQYSDEEDYGGNDVLEINDAVDAYTMETKVLIHQRKVVSSFEKMYEDVCDCIEDLRISIIFLSFHKHQRLDGKMESGKEGARATNNKVLRHAPCSVGIFVDRGQTGFQLPSSQSMQNVATLFFGGPDDREALACSKKIAAHPHISLTLIHFLPAKTSSEHEERTDTTPHRNDEILMEMSNYEIEAEIDKAFVQDFYSRYVTSGQVGYVDKYVESGLQTAEALRDIHDTYSLFIVGKGGRGNSPLTTGMSDWEECPELGTVGDLLASSNNINGSVLVIQQYRHSRNDLRDD